jgi:pyruvate ferredoxin oxidoreductase delta subunit
MATSENLLRDWDGFTPGALLTSFANSQSHTYSENNSYMHSVADWRVEKPIFNAEHCIHCQFCWVYCPDTSIISVDKKFSHIDYVHCKGCGICAHVCPTNPKSLIMFTERTDDAQAIANWPKKESNKDAQEGQ